MRMFSSCSGSCYTCTCSGMCLAGHGDDDYEPVSKEQLVERINEQLDIIKRIAYKSTVEIRDVDLDNLRSANTKLKDCIEALAKGSW